MIRYLLGAAALCTGFITVPAFAAEVDFRSSAFAAAHNDPSFTYTAEDGVTLTITAGPQPFARLQHNSTDGFGVRLGYENDEIESYESLTVSFSETVLISDVFITDLFIENPLLGRPYAEVGYYTTSGGTTQFHAIQGAGTNGELTLNPDIWADAIVFTAPGWVGLQNHEYSVAGLSYSTHPGNDVPELDPGAGGAALTLLLGAALLIGERRRVAAAV